ncbi:MAG: helix-turn-helix domain-containing protein [Verrucomicrobiales bacterium]|nr:helix-turn-helix domain-containing protein [Verrucomicrobiales bacterium]
MQRLRDLGWNICRQRIARIEACEACVSDFEMVFVTTALNVEFKDLIPKIDGTQPLYVAISKLLAGQIKTVMSPDDILLDRSLRCLAAIHLDGQFVQNCGQCATPELVSFLSKRKDMDTATSAQTQPSAQPRERLSYSIHEAADLLGVEYFSVYRLIQRKKLRACRALRGKLLIPRTELLKLLNTE